MMERRGLGMEALLSIAPPQHFSFKLDCLSGSATSMLRLGHKMGWLDRRQGLRKHAFDSFWV
jgi:hypothetical protein